MLERELKEALFTAPKLDFKESLKYSEIPIKFHIFMEHYVIIINEISIPLMKIKVAT